MITKTLKSLADSLINQAQSLRHNLDKKFEDVVNIEQSMQELKMNIPFKGCEFVHDNVTYSFEWNAHKIVSGFESDRKKAGAKFCVLLNDYSDGLHTKRFLDLPQWKKLELLAYFSPFVEEWTAFIYKKVQNVVSSNE